MGSTIKLKKNICNKCKYNSELLDNNWKNK